MSKNLFSFPLIGTLLVGSSGIFALGLALGASFSRASVQGKEGHGDSLDASKLPAEVQTTAKKYYAKLDGLKASKESEHGATLYEIEGKGPEGMGLDIKVCANGQIVEVEREVSADVLPADGRANLAKQFPDAKTTKVEAVEMHYYGIHLLSKDGKKSEVGMGASGRVVANEEGDEDGDEDGEEGDEKK